MSHETRRRKSPPFGRRLGNLQGWVIIPGRPRLPCNIKNLSTAGAFLELMTPGWMPIRFVLAIEPDQQTHLCEIKQSRTCGIIVNFIAVEQGIAGSTNEAQAITEADKWSGSGGQRLRRFSKT